MPAVYTVSANSVTCRSKIGLDVQWRSILHADDTKAHAAPTNCAREVVKVGPAAVSEQKSRSDKAKVSLWELGNLEARAMLARVSMELMYPSPSVSRTIRNNSEQFVTLGPAMLLKS